MTSSPPTGKFSVLELLPFTEYVAGLLSRYCSQSSIRTNLTELANSYHAQKGAFTFISARGEGHSFCIQNAPALPDNVERLTVYFPAQLLFSAMCFGIVGRIEATDIVSSNGTIHLNRAFVVPVYEKFIFESASSNELGLSLENEAHRIAHSYGRKETSTLILYAQQNTDGTFRLLSPEEQA